MGGHVIRRWVDSRAVAVLYMSIMVGVVFVDDQNWRL
jgi:hypothetical protein